MAAVPQSEPARFAPRRLCHTNIVVGDLERSIRFYNEVCGLELVRREPGIGAAFLSNGNSHHDVATVQSTSDALIGIGGHVQAAAGISQRPGLSHLGWEVDNEAQVAAAWRRAVATGVRIDTTSNHQVAHSVYLYDTDGNLHEFYADIVEDWRKVFNPEVEDLITEFWDPSSGAPTTKSYWGRNPEIHRVENAVFHPLRTTRGVFVAKDFEGLKRFFLDVGGLAPVPGTPQHYALFRGAAAKDDWNVAVFAPRAGLAPGFHHMVLEIPDEASLLASEKKAGASGVEIELVVDRPHKRSVFIRDPDAMLIEFRCARAGRPEMPAAVPPELHIYHV